VKLHPGLKWAIKTKALNLRLRFWDTMTDKEAMRRAMREELAQERASPRNWAAWWKAPSKRVVEEAARDITKLLNTPPTPPPMIRRRPRAAS